ncbi:isopeptide-forming domain-containing fimbrial protein [Psychrobacter sp. 1Y11]|uniref:isopeptide-forming domain-containing fimbrial protein n=1 Tax=Psychrobacter sp. 1Y11 TaxID=3457446 RepID=UPI003FD3A9B9
MRSNTFNYSLLAVGVAALMGVSTGAMAATSGEAENKPSIANQASASYSVGGITQEPVDSNTVTINITEQISFALTAQNADNDPEDDLNDGGDVSPEEIVQFKHRLQNTGNRTDEYTVKLSNVLNGSGDEANYNLSASTVDYQIKNEDGKDANVPNASGTGLKVSDINNIAFELEAGQYVDFTINAKTNGNIGGDTQDLTLTATSTALSTNTPTGVDATLTNTDTSNTVLPVFSIVKSITDTLNLNDLNDTATYSITVTNDGDADYAADATNIIVRDTLPPGLILVPDSVTSVDATTGATAQETTTGPNQGFVYSGIDLAVGDSVTITFNVKQNPDVAPANGVVNHARVEDTLKNGVTIIDSTNNTDTDENTGTYYPANDDNENTNGTPPTTPGGDSTEGLEVNKRNIAISPGTNKEIAPKGTVEFTHTITNKGDADEGGAKRQINITITDPAGNALKVNNPVYIDDSGTEQALIPVDAPNGVYRLPDSVVIAPTESVDIRYDVVADADDPDALDTTEDNVVTVNPQGNDGSDPVAATNTTTIKGLALAKTAALDEFCDGTADTAFSQSPKFTAKPNQCVIYNIDATNTSSVPTTTNPYLGFEIADVVISDVKAQFANGAIYVDNSAATTGDAPVTADATDNGTAITTTVSPLAPQETATLQFRVKIKNDPVAAPNP